MSKIKFEPIDLSFSGSFTNTLVPKKPDPKWTVLMRSLEIERSQNIKVDGAKIK